MDYEYWLVYMLNATLVSIPFLCDGLCSPIIPPVPLPGIYFPIAPPVMIPVVNVLMVFGIAIRGIWPAPIILLVNTIIKIKENNINDKDINSCHILAEVLIRVVNIIMDQLRKTKKANSHLFYHLAFFDCLVN